MATAAQNGSCIVWDLKQKKPWCELRDSARAPVTDVAWNPEQGQHLVTGKEMTHHRTAIKGVGARACNRRMPGGSGRYETGAGGGRSKHAFVA